MFSQKAIELFSFAIQSRNAWAMKQLGQIFADGRPGIEKNINKAIEWLGRAAALGYNSAFEKLSQLVSSKVYPLPSPDDLTYLF